MNTVELRESSFGWICSLQIATVVGPYVVAVKGQFVFRGILFHFMSGYIAQATYIKLI